MTIKTGKKQSEETIIKDWTLSISDKQELSRYHKNNRLFAAIQICSVRLYGRFLFTCQELPAEITNYLTYQLKLPLTLTVKCPTRKATYTKQRQNILVYLGFKKF